MKRTILAASSSLALLAAGCTSTPVGTLNNQGAFGQASVENQFVQIAYATPERMKDLAEAFANSVPTMVNFEFNGAGLDAEAKRIIAEQAAFIKRYPQVRFTVVGHTDLVGSQGYNKSLGHRRARAVVNELVRNGANRKQLRAVASRGEREPLVSTSAPERLNRRTITTVSGFDSGFVGTGMDGKRALIVYNEYVGDEGSEIVVQDQ